MNNIVDEIDILKDKIETEVSLRHATDVEMRNEPNDEEGPMRAAHDASLEELVAAARALIAKVDGSG
jgi:hypothetical protein